MLKGKSLSFGGEELSILDDSCSLEDIERSLAASKIQKNIRASSLNGMQNKILESIITAGRYRYLIDNYKSTLELSDAYNKSNVFSKIVKEDDCEEVAVNPYKDDLLLVAREVLERYRYIKNPNRDQTFEIANLSGFANIQISKKIFNIFMNGVYALKRNIVDIYKIEAMPTVLRLLPPGFLSKEQPDVIIEILSTLSEWLGKEYLKLKDPKVQEDRLLPILKIYADVLDSIIDNMHLHHLSESEYNQNISLSVIIESYRRDILAKRFKAKSLCLINLESCLSIDHYVQDKIAVWVKKLSDHPVIEVKYLSMYIIESISRLSGSKDNNLLHLILGARSFNLISSKLNNSLDSYKELFKYAMRELEKPNKSHEEWYNKARYIKAIILDAKSDPAKLRFALDQINSYYKTENTPEWVVSYVSLEVLMSEANNCDDLQMPLDILSLAARVALDNRYNISVHEAAIGVLISSSSSHIEEVSISAKRYIKEHVYPFFSRLEATVSNSLMTQMEVIGAVQIKPPVLQKNIAKHNDILSMVKNKIFPLEQKITNMREKISSAPNDFFVESGFKNYIPLKGSISKYSLDDSDFFFMEENIKSFVEDKSFHRSPTLLIYGDSGSGKSLFGRHIEKKYWDKYTKGGTIPLFISLSSLNNPRHKVIEQALQSYGFSQADILQLKLEGHRDKGSYKKIWSPKKADDGNYERDQYGKIVGIENQKDCNSPRLLIILDGYNEINGNFNIHEAYETEHWPHLKIIVTCRTEYLNNISKSNLFSSGSSSSYEEIFIKSFDNSQINLFAAKFLKLKQELSSAIAEENFVDLIINNKDLNKMATNPLLLKIIMDVLPELKKTKEHEASIYKLTRQESSIGMIGKVTRYELYNIFISNWFNRLQSTDEAFNAESYAISVASFMFKNDVNTIKEGSLNFSISNSEFPEEMMFFGDNIKTLYRETAPFKSIGKMCYAFMHASICDFFIAKAMLADIRSIKEDGHLNQGSIFNLAHIQKNRSVLNFVLDEITPKDLQSLEQIILSTRLDTKEGKISSMVIASANAATLYVRTRYTQAVGNKDWSYTQISGADISGAYFYGMNFTGCKWINVTARSLRMYSSKCDDMDLTGFYTGEYASLRGHDNSIHSIYVNESYVFSGSSDKTVRVWDRDSGECVYVLEGHNSDVLSVCASGNYIFSGSSDKTIRVWHAETGKCIRILEGHKESVKSLCLISSYLISGSIDSTVIIWDKETGKCIRVLEGHKSWVYSVCADASRIFSCSFDNSIRVWNINTGESIQVLKGHDGVVNSLAIDDNYIFSGSDDNTIRVWDKDTGTCIKVLQGHNGSVCGICFDGSYLFSGSVDCTVMVWDIGSGKCLKVLEGHEYSVTSVYASGGYLFSGSYDKTIRVSETGTYFIAGQYLDDSHKSSVISMHVSRSYVFRCSDKLISILDRKTGERIKILEGHTDIVNSIYTRGDYVFSGSKDSTIRVWSKETGGCLHVLEGHKGYVNAVYATESYVFSGGADNAVRVWDINFGGCLHVLNKHYDEVTSVCSTSPYVFSASYDKTVIIWDIKSGSCLRVLEGHNSKVTSICDSGSYLFSGSYDKTLRIWDIASGACVGVLQGHNRYVTSLCASDLYVFSGSYDNTVRVWDKDNDTCIQVLEGHDANIIKLQVNSNRLVSADSSGMTIFWNIEDINNIKLDRAFGRSSWQQSLKFVDNKAHSIYGLSKNNQQLFEQYNFKANFKEHSIVSNSYRDLMLELQMQNKELKGKSDKIVEQNKELKAEVNLIKEQLSLQKSDLDRKHAQIVSQQNRIEELLKNVLNKVGVGKLDAEALRVNRGNDFERMSSTVSSLTLSTDDLPPSPSCQELERNKANGLDAKFF